MAGSPRFKVYSATGDYIGCVKEASDAGALVSLYGDGATIRDGHGKPDIVWTEGVDGQAAESYDRVAETVYARVEERWAAGPSAR